MTTFVNAPPEIESLRDVLDATAAWTFGTTKINYPEADPDDADVSGTWCILTLESGREAQIWIYSTALDEGELMDLGLDLRGQLPSRYRTDLTGIWIFPEPELSPIGEPNDGTVAADDQTVLTFSLTLNIGVNEE